MNHLETAKDRIDYLDKYEHDGMEEYLGPITHAMIVIAEALDSIKFKLSILICIFSFIAGMLLVN